MCLDDNLDQDLDEDCEIVNVGNKFNDKQEAGWSGHARTLNNS